MPDTLDFPDLLRLLDKRCSAFRAVIAAAPSLDVQVPTCPEWTLLDLAEHLAEGRQFWATVVSAGPADGPPARPASPAWRDRDAVEAWLGASMEQLLRALHEAGPDRGCWTWWGPSQSPQTAGAVARHQLQQVAVHTYDAQVTLGTPEPLGAEVALDGVEEFLVTCCATTSPWPHEPALVDYHATEGRSWRVFLSAEGARATRVPFAADAADDADVSLWGSAHELVMYLYGRIPLSSLRVQGDVEIFDRLFAWEPGD